MSKSVIALITIALSVSTFSMSAHAQRIKDLSAEWRAIKSVGGLWVSCGS